ncbi:MAG: hypothetical protein PHP08_00850 [Candidatus Dojkabacteria bacterium]|nr:hypothetical protein [Candidatus Dojkabacteria bacterium]
MTKPDALIVVKDGCVEEVVSAREGFVYRLVDLDEPGYKDIFTDSNHVDIEEFTINLMKENIKE